MIVIRVPLVMIYYEDGACTTVHVLIRHCLIKNKTLSYQKSFSWEGWCWLIKMNVDWLSFFNQMMVVNHHWWCWWWIWSRTRLGSTALAGLVITLLAGGIPMMIFTQRRKEMIFKMMMTQVERVSQPSLLPLDFCWGLLVWCLWFSWFNESLIHGGYDDVVSRPTRWYLWYWYLDFFVDHLWILWILQNPDNREI